MHKRFSWPLVLILATLIHVDWHFARPLHHRLSLDWSTHWIFCIAIFAAAGWYIARRWPDAPWKAAAWNVGLALFFAQVVEPLLETAHYDRRLAYDLDPMRWTVFWECVGAGVPAVVLVIWWMTSRRARRSNGAVE
jgi:hypothetical protein